MEMKKLLAAAVAMMALSASALAEPYVVAGFAAGTDSASLSLGAGFKVGWNIAIEGAYLAERGPNEIHQVNDPQGGVNGSAGVTLQNRVHRDHGFGAALIGFAPLGRDLDLVGKAGRQRMTAGGDRNVVGAGLQYGTMRETAIRALIENAGGQTMLSISVIKSF